MYTYSSQVYPNSLLWIDRTNSFRCLWFMYNSLLFIIRVKRELKRVYRNGCRYNERLNAETGGSKTPLTHWVARAVDVQVYLQQNKPMAIFFVFCFFSFPFLWALSNSLRPWKPLLRARPEATSSSTTLCWNRSVQSQRLLCPHTAWIQPADSFLNGLTSRERGERGRNRGKSLDQNSS